MAVTGKGLKFNAWAYRRLKSNPNGLMDTRQDARLPRTDVEMWEDWYGLSSEAHYVFPTGGCVTGGSADVDNVCCEVGSGGATCAGSADFVYQYQAQALNFVVDGSGGMATAGIGLVANVILKPVSGGCVTGSSAVVSCTINRTESGYSGMTTAGSGLVANVGSEVGSGGISTGGALTIAIVVSPGAVGGCVTGSSATVAIVRTIAGSGGCVTAGVGLPAFVFVPVGSGGASTSGIVLFGREVAVTGGIVTGGTAPYAKGISGLGGMATGGSAVVSATVERSVIGVGGGNTFGGAVESVVVVVPTSGGAVSSGGVAVVVTRVLSGLGGPYSNGSADYVFTKAIVGSGGVTMSGGGAIAIVIPEPSGGLSTSGGSSALVVVTVRSVSGGVVTLGGADITCGIEYSITGQGLVVTACSADVTCTVYDVNVATGGVVTDGSAVLSIVNVETGSGGLATDSSADRIIVFAPSSVGGIATGGSATVRTSTFGNNTFAGIGGIDASGRALVSVRVAQPTNGGVSSSGLGVLSFVKNVVGAGIVRTNGFADKTVKAVLTSIGGLTTRGYAAISQMLSMSVHAVANTAIAQAKIVKRLVASATGKIVTTGVPNTKRSCTGETKGVSTGTSSMNRFSRLIANVEGVSSVDAGCGVDRKVASSCSGKITVLGELDRECSVHASAVADSGSVLDGIESQLVPMDLSATGIEYSFSDIVRLRELLLHTEQDAVLSLDMYKWSKVLEPGFRRIVPSRVVRRIAYEDERVIRVVE